MLLDEELYSSEENEEFEADQRALADELIFRMESLQRQYEDLNDESGGQLAAGRLLDDINFYENELHKLGAL